MYAQITTRCNMACAHCCFGCGRRGVDMGLETFGAVLKCCEGILTLGGGEPTVHPQFWTMLRLALGEGLHVSVITNGKRSRDALKMVRAAQAHPLRLSVLLSRDRFHGAISEGVVAAFTGLGRAAIKNCAEPIKAGRWGTGNADGCPCDDLFVKPDGSVMGCGCADAVRLGDVWGFKKPLVSCCKELSAYPFEITMPGPNIQVWHLEQVTPWARLGQRLAEFYFDNTHLIGCGVDEFEKRLGVTIPEGIKERFRAQAG